MGDSAKGKLMTEEAFSDMKTPDFVYDINHIRQQLGIMADKAVKATDADRYAAEYYREQHPLLWIDMAGVKPAADTLLTYLRQVGTMGFSQQSFLVNDIEKDLQHMRQLDFDNHENTLSQVAARLEYRLTRACLRYSLGLRYGFVQPHRVFNHLDVDKQDTLRRITIYRELFDIDIDRPDHDAVRAIMEKVSHDSIDAFLRDIQPATDYYRQLSTMLKTAATEEDRQRIVCNMERARWRQHRPIDHSVKHVVVNIPSLHLYACCPDSIVAMRIACGARTTKTPLLTSDIEWMEVNPQWVIPRSILEKDVAHHAGDSAYFARNHYRIIDRETNEPQDVATVSRQMLLSGKYRVAQESGTHNSLGRLVLRFKNKFSVFLHYTSSPGVFERESRTVSHGCVRVAEPFRLARFVLTDPDEWLLERMRIAMELKPETDRGQRYVAEHPDEEDHKKLVGYVPVKPRVPLYIIYNTIWPDENGTLRQWPDLYGYDNAIWNNLQPYMQ